MFFKPNSNKFDNNYYQNKSQLLRQAALSILNDPYHAQNLAKLRTNLNLNLNEIIDAYINYDLDISKNSNELYQSLEMRYVLHMHNLLKGSWHLERQQTVIDFIKIAAPTSIVDMGFGVPGRYVQECLKNEKYHITLCDIDHSAITFSEALFDIWNGKKWQKHINFNILDMNQGDIVLNQDLYIFQSSIEHVINCTRYLKDHVQQSKYNAYFLLSLPLGKITPEHYYEWKTAQDVYGWLNHCGLKVLQSKTIKVNAEVDIFADYHNYEYYDFFVICQKIFRKNLL